MSKQAKTATVLMIVSIGLFLVSCGGCKSAAPQQTTQTMPTPPQSLSLAFQSENWNSLPARVALEKNFFKGKVVDRERKGGFSFQKDLVEDLIAGKIDAADADLAVVLTALARGELKGKIVATGSREGISLVVRDGEIKTHIELAGFSLAVAERPSMAEYVLHRFLVRNKLDGQVYIVKVPPAEMADALLRRRIVAGFIESEPIASKAVAEENAGIMATSNVWAPNHPTWCLVATDRAIASDPEGIRAMTAGFKAAVDWIHANPLEAEEFIARAYGKEGEHAKTALARMKFDCRIDLKELEAVARHVNELGYAGISDPAAFATAFVDFSFLP